MKDTARFLWYILIISIGGCVIGIDLGLIATTLAQPAFHTFMFPKGTHNVSSLTGAIVSLGSAGNAIGCLCNGLLLEKLGRKKTLLISTFFTIVGAIFQAAANGVALMIVGRFVAGFALGILNPTIPIYISELSRPQERARLVGVFGLLVAIGFCLANWIGYASSFAPGDGSWRVALAMQVPLAIVLMACSVILPESPRWLAQQEKYAAFDDALHSLYSDETPEFFVRTQIEIREQIRLEAANRANRNLGHALLELFNKKNISRTAMAIMVMQVGILSGSLAIQNYQSLLYASLGFKDRKAILISGFYGIMGIIGQIVNLVVVSDKWSRKNTMWIGCLVLASILSILMVLSRFYGDGHNINGARAGVAFVFIYSLLYAVFFNSTLFTIAAETFPQHLRGYGTSIAALCQGVTAIWLGQVTPYAFEAITWKYYSVFIGSLLILSVFYRALLTETNQLSLELIAGEFGDETYRGRVVEDRKDSYTGSGHRRGATVAGSQASQASRAASRSVDVGSQRSRFANSRGASQSGDIGNTGEDYSQHVELSYLPPRVHTPRPHTPRQRPAFQRADSINTFAATDSSHNSPNRDQEVETLNIF